MCEVSTSSIQRASKGLLSFCCDSLVYVGDGGGSSVVTPSVFPRNPTGKCNQQLDLGAPASRAEHCRSQVRRTKMYGSAFQLQCLIA